MSITVKDILGLDIFENAELVAGKKGIHREVTRVNFTDSPLDPDDPGYTLVAQGDLYIRSFYEEAGQGNEQIVQLIRFYIQSGSSCCIGVRYHPIALPPEVIRLADSHEYPVIMIENDIPYGQIIQDISELILTDQLDLHSENKINRLLYDAVSVREQGELMQSLVPDMPQDYVCFCVGYPALEPLRFRSLKNDLSRQFGVHLLRYQKGGFFMMDLAVFPNPANAMPLLYRVFEHYGDTFWLGVSGRCSGPKDVTRCFKESRSAYQISQVTGQRVSYYDEVSVYTLLLSIQDLDVLHAFCRKTLEPLEEYGNRHSIDLVETVRAYLSTNGSTKETAALLNTHENTVRFRIQKARSLLGRAEESFAFIEQMSLALKAQKLLLQ